MKVLVTGANGYIGSHVVDILLAKGLQVVAADIDVSRVPDGAEKMPISILNDDPDIYDRLGKPDVCIHMAWRNGFSHNHPSHIEDLPAHYRFVSRMIEGGVSHLSVMGTMHEIGYWEGMIQEDTPCSPQSFYGISKNALRQITFQLASTKKTPVTWLRGYYIYGDDERNHSIFTKILQMDREGKEFFPFTSGKNLYDFVQVDTLAEMIVESSLQDEETGVIELCSGKPISLADKVSEFIMERRLSIRPQYGAYPDRPYDSPGVWGNPLRIQRIMAKSLEKKYE